jgi:hypothetical protein
MNKKNATLAALVLSLSLSLSGLVAVADEAAPAAPVQEAKEEVKKEGQDVKEAAHKLRDERRELRAAKRKLRRAAKESVKEKAGQDQPPATQ